ncbi:RNA recognition motif domain-containing protein [Bowmanella yangjiangensis]|uniref:RNA-binding protein n=1 Tax=Bowmanella yangjiangensis TaxID=2811230 RepID=A0ABS3CXT5_9ALTE|nr:RNA-binding protein [Bowmanella yangjiangensis]MBN7821930.1 RNA-binding protein [Bowmanella yangjiangensis]
MKSPVLLYIVIAGLLAVLGYFLLPAQTMNANQALALGLVIGGILTPLLASQFLRQSSSSTSTDNNEHSDSKTLYVGNLPYRVNEQDVKAHFAPHGTVISVRLMKDRRTGKRKGYGFVEMVGDTELIVRTLNDTEFQDRTLKVRMAKDKQEE